MNFQDQQNITGIFTLVVRDRDGRVLSIFEEKNLIVNGAKNQLARLIAGNVSDRHITRIGFGTGTTAANPNDTGLTNAFYKPITSVTYPATGRVSFTWSLSTAEANGLAITEFGLLCADLTLFARKQRAAINKSDDISLDGTWTIIF